jgi:hypothetical protein
MWCACLLLLVATVRWPYIGWPWAHIYHWIPGAAVTRVVSRVQFVLLIPTTIVGSATIVRAWAFSSARVLIVPVVSLLLLEQLNNREVFLIDRPTELRAKRSWVHALCAPAQRRVTLARAGELMGACRAVLAPEERGRLG